MEFVAVRDMEAPLHTLGELRIMSRTLDDNCWHHHFTVSHQDLILFNKADIGFLNKNLLQEFFDKLDFIHDSQFQPPKRSLQIMSEWILTMSDFSWNDVL